MCELDARGERALTARNHPQREGDFRGGENAASEFAREFVDVFCPSRSRRLKHPLSGVPELFQRPRKWA